MTSERDRGRGLALQRCDGRAKTLLIALCAATRWRTLRTRLTERKITAQNHPSGIAKSVGDRDEQRSSAVCACSMGQHEGRLRRAEGAVQEAANGYGIRGGMVEKFLIIVHALQASLTDRFMDCRVLPGD